ncbi:hypothetical protein N7523_001940 [Penicillium sp. IBT 18751x]|nr:hypothetical protein N7523_001940 [Penicillium sp. IBT 18751x]
MADTHHGGQRIDRNLVAKLCQILDSAAVPNLLWGNYLLTVYGVPTIVEDVAFVVLDDNIETASSALQAARYALCPKGVSCPRVHGFHTPPPSEHFHIYQDLTIFLYRKSEMLWKFEDLEFSRFKDAVDVMSASDLRIPTSTPGRGQGRVSPEMSFVKIPSAVKFCEASILLLCRDYDTIHETYWMAILTYILEYVDGTDMFDGKDLGDEYQRFYFAIRDGDSSMWSLLDELRLDFMSKGWLQASIETTETT